MDYVVRGAHWSLNLRYAVLKTQRRKLVNFGQKGYSFIVMSNHDMLRKVSKSCV